MKKILLLILAAAFAASLFHTFQWERDARRDWKELASYRADLAEVLR